MSASVLNAVTLSESVFGRRGRPLAGSYLANLTAADRPNRTSRARPRRRTDHLLPAGDGQRSWDNDRRRSRLL